MAIKKLEDSPNISDEIIITLKCPDSDGCFLANPYKVDNVKIYYVQRSFAGTNYSSYEKKIYDPAVQEGLETAIKNACDDPSENNLAIVERLTNQLDASATSDTFYFSEARSVAVFGTDEYPAWLSSDTGNAFITNIQVDQDGNPIFGIYELYWKPLGMREGDYFICWTWTPNPAGDKITNHIHFNLAGDTQLTTSIPTHFTNPKKYDELLEQYLPQTFKMRLAEGDLSPEVLQELNRSVAKGFTFLEDMTNQIGDLLDSNTTHESLLPFLSNLFACKLRSNDPTLWRRQIKRAIPLYKKKGTYSGLEEALAQSGIILNKITRLWQVRSEYSYQESFKYSDSAEFELKQTAASNDILVYYRPSDSDTWQELTDDYVDFQYSYFTWVGETVISDPITLEENDEIRILYFINIPPDVDEENKEDYFRTLPLMDLRDERDQQYPLKDWNTRLIEEDDAMFDVMIPIRHPYADPVMYGWVRTEFPYSENIYNMEEYNGSSRESTNPCDIDKDFLDTCGSCLSSKIKLDLDISDLSDDRYSEALQVIKEFTPFHSLIQSVSLSGSVNEFILSPIEEIKALVNFAGQEFTISGNALTAFNRSMTSLSQYKRNELANLTTVVNSDSATAYNEQVSLFCPYARLDDISLDGDSDYTFLEVLSPSANAGEYTVANAEKHSAVIDGGSISEPLDQSAFTFRLSNERAVDSNASIYQDDLFKFKDNSFSFSNAAVKTEWDVINTEYPGSAWTITIAAYSDEYEIANILSDGSIILKDPNKTLPTSNTSSITYILKDDSGNTINSGSTGILTVSRRGRVELDSTILIRGDNITLSDVRDLMDSYHNNGENHYVLYDSNQYEFFGFIDGSTRNFYIKNYTDGDVVGTNIVIYQRLLNSQTGYFNYKGLKLTCLSDMEVFLGVQNGANADTLFADLDSHGDPYTLQLENNHFKENFLVLIGSDYYAISEIDGNDIWLVGPEQNWYLTGTSVNFDIYRYDKASGEIPSRDYPPMHGFSFDFLDRRGSEIIEMTIDTAPSMLMLSSAFNASEENQDQIVDSIKQTESINFTVKTKDNQIFEGNL